MKEQLRERHKRTKLRCGPDGLNGVDPLETSMISLLKTSPKINETDYSELLSLLSVMTDF